MSHRSASDATESSSRLQRVVAERDSLRRELSKSKRLVARLSGVKEMMTDFVSNVDEVVTNSGCRAIGAPNATSSLVETSVLSDANLSLAQTSSLAQAFAKSENERAQHLASRIDRHIDALLLTDQSAPNLESPLS